MGLNFGDFCDVAIEEDTEILDFTEKHTHRHFGFGYYLLPAYQNH